MLRRVWKVLPGPLRIPVLVVAALVGLWYLITGRKQDAEGNAGV